MNSTLTLKYHSLVQAIVVEKESVILGPKTKSLNDHCINQDFAFSSSQIEQNCLIPLQNISSNQNMDNDFPLESVNQDCLLQTGTSNFQHLESYHALYPDLFTDTNIQTLWSVPMQSDLLYKNEENISIQDIDEENNLINIAHESHAYNNIEEVKLEDKTISYNVGDTNLFTCKLIESSKPHEFQRESAYSKVVSKFDFQIYDDDTSSQNISSTLTFPGSFNHNLDMLLFDYYPDKIAISHSIESSQDLDLLQSSFYDPVYAWLEESYFKRFSCHLLLPFVNILPI